MDRFSATWLENLLVPVWIRAMPDVERKLRRGARVADAGCGRGRALLELARVYPKGRYVGFDASGQAVAQARKRAWEQSLAGRVRFEWRDPAEGLPGRFDVITAFDFLHDAARPRTLARKIRRALRSDGTFLCLEIDSSVNLEDNAGPVGSLFYSLAALYSTAIALAEGGDAPGAMGLPEPRLRALCAEAGFHEIRRVPIEDAFHALYEIRP